MHKTAWTVIAVLIALEPALRAAERKTDNVILITLDGARWQEIFGGLDLDVLGAATRKGKAEETAAYKKYWAATPEERRAKVMPFFWSVWMKDHGSIAGNRGIGSTVQITNRHRFSYPGYSEILTGSARDDVIDSNDKKRNPTTTVLEFLKRKLGLDARQVAAFTSWDTLDWAVEHEAGAITSNAGFEPYDHPDPLIRALGRLQVETDTAWDSVRHDAYTFRFAMAHLETYRPRVLYIGFGETDDWAHDGNYRRVLDALERTDGYLRQLWTFLQSDAQYRDRTTILITVDHGRGNTPADWRDHGAKVEGAQYIWLAAVSPDSARRGEWRSAATLYQNQVAATLCRALGLDYRENNKDAGAPIDLFAH